MRKIAVLLCVIIFCTSCSNSVNNEGSVPESSNFTIFDIESWSESETFSHQYSIKKRISEDMPLYTFDFSYYNVMTKEETLKFIEMFPEILRHPAWGVKLSVKDEFGTNIQTILMDCSPMFKPSEYNVVDINSDGYNDISMLFDIQGNKRVHNYRYWVWDSERNKFIEQN